MEPARARYRSIVADNARWEGFEFRDGDIIISTPPKCGTTWTQTICGLLIFRSPTFPRALDLVSPWLDQQLRDRDSVVGDLDAQTHRRFIKTHTPFDGLPYDERVTYICVGRDPRDVAMSWDNHMANMDMPAFIALREKAVGLDDVPELLAAAPPVMLETERERFWQWVDDPSPLEMTTVGLAFTLHHFATFWDKRSFPNVVLLHYGELKEDLNGQMRALAVRLGIDVPEQRWAELVAAATFDAMRSRAAEVGPNTTEPIWLDTERFFHRGTNGQWRDLLDENDLRRYKARVDELARAGLSAWAHRGPVID